MGLIKDTLFNICVGITLGHVNAMFVTKKNGDLFEETICQELGLLRNRFLGILKYPKLNWRLDFANSIRFSPITNQVKVFYYENRPSIIELFETLKIAYVHYPEERTYILKLGVFCGIVTMHYFEEQLKLSGLFTMIEHQFFDIMCIY